MRNRPFHRPTITSTTTISVIVVGDTPILLSAKTHMMLKSGLTNLVGHEVWVHGVRINNGVSAYVLYELETL